MSAGKQRTPVKVTILGEEYVVRSATSPEETHAVATYVDSTIREIMQSGAAIETHRAVILACLRIAGELSEARKASGSVNTTMLELIEEVRPWLPPAKRYD
jgi:cell division protein ZapA (FtsZ GTPase activity inhibitor)